MENNTRKYVTYAIGEIVLVVIGILIALSINNWNENRKYIKERQYLLTELLDEFKSNRTELERTYNLNIRFLAKNDSILNMIPMIKLPGEEQKLTDALIGPGMFNIETFNPSEGLINSMLNTSNFQHIENKNLRRNLLNWSGYIDDFDENVSEWLVYREAVFQ